MIFQMFSNKKVLDHLLSRAGNEIKKQSVPFIENRASL